MMGKQDGTRRMETLGGAGASSDDWDLWLVVPAVAPTLKPEREEREKRKQGDLKDLCVDVGCVRGLVFVPEPG